MEVRYEGFQAIFQYFLTVKYLRSRNVCIFTTERYIYIIFFLCVCLERGKGAMEHYDKKINVSENEM